jgi:hypothetical protein
MDAPQRSATPEAAGTLQKKKYFLQKNNVFNLKSAQLSSTKAVK